MKTRIFCLYCLSMLPAFFGCYVVAAAKTDKTDFYSTHKPFGLFIEPTALISLYNSGAARFGVEIPVMHDVGLVYTNCLYTNGYGFKAAIKIYDDVEMVTPKPGFLRVADQRFYASLEYYYKAYSYENSDSVKGSSNGLRYYHVEKFATTVSVQVGVITTSGGGLYYDWYVGLGMRVKTVNNDLKDGESDNFYHWHEGFVTGFTDSKAFKQVGPHISLGLRVGWRYR